jgi:beta-phosphoglucomutase family hydrolase
MARDSRNPGDHRVTISRGDFDAAMFDMDGVVTRTADMHAAAWKQLFDEYRADRIARGLPAYQPFDIDSDYRQFVDGRPRYDGVAAFLASRGIALPHGSSSDDAIAETVCGLGNRKEGYFWERVQVEGVEAYSSTVSLIHEMRAAGMKIGVFSASRNAGRILAAAGAVSLFDEKVDGKDAAELGLAGKPDPSMLIELARRLHVQPMRCVVFEDAIAGVQAGRSGGFGTVIGVNRSPAKGELLAHGADAEVADLGEISVLS